MDTDAKGQLGGLQCDDDARKKMASRSGEYACPTCQKSNRTIMDERAEEVKKLADEGKETKEEEVPEELRLAYREDLVQASDKKSETGAKDTSQAETTTSTPPTSNGSATPAASQMAQLPARRAPARAQDSNESWIDMAIYGIAAVLVLLVARKMLA
jgi:ubiquitin-conjugating enzyme E2 J1